MQALQFCWAVGLIIAPLISRPFLSKAGEIYDEGQTFITAEDVEVKEVNLINVEMMQNATELIHEESQLYYPYGIAGSSLAFGTMMLLGLYVYQKKIANKEKVTKQSEAEKVELNKEKDPADFEKEVEPSQTFTRLMVGLSCILVSFFCAAEMTTLHYLPTFVAHVDLGLSKLTGPLVLSACATSFTIGRLSGIFLAIILKPEHILFIDWIFMCIGNMILLFSNTSETMLWLGSVIIGFGFAAFFPAVFSFLKNRLNVTNGISAMLLLSSLSANALGFPVLVGKYIETMPLIMAHANFLCLAVIGLVFIGMILTEVKYKSKQLKLKEPVKA